MSGLLGMAGAGVLLLFWAAQGIQPRWKMKKGLGRPLHTTKYLRGLFAFPVRWLSFQTGWGGRKSQSQSHGWGQLPRAALVACLVAQPSLLLGWASLRDHPQQLNFLPCWHVKGEYHSHLTDLIYGKTATLWEALTNNFTIKTKSIIQKTSWSYITHLFD